MTAPLAIADVMGSWTVEGGAVNRRCTLSLSGFGPESQHSTTHHPALAENCAGSPFENARGWRLDAATFEVLDAHDRVIARFGPAGVDEFRSVGGQAAWRLTRAALG